MNFYVIRIVSYWNSWSKPPFLFPLIAKKRRNIIYNKLKFSLCNDFFLKMFEEFSEKINFFKSYI